MTVWSGSLPQEAGKVASLSTSEEEGDRHLGEINDVFLGRRRAPGLAETSAAAHAPVCTARRSCWSWNSSGREDRHTLGPLFLSQCHRFGKAWPLKVMCSQHNPWHKNSLLVLPHLLLQQPGLEVSAPKHCLFLVFPPMGQLHLFSI